MTTQTTPTTPATRPDNSSRDNNYRPQNRNAGGPRGPRGRYFPRRRICSFCVEHAEFIDYKDVDKLRRYISERAKIEPPRKTGVCAKHQRLLAAAVKKARHLALIPYIPGQSFRFTSQR